MCRRSDDRAMPRTAGTGDRPCSFSFDYTFKRTTSQVMRSYLAVVSEQFSKRVLGPGGSAVELTDTALPTSAASPDGKRLLDAIERARREIRVRLRSTPAGGDAPLRLGVVTTTDAGTGMEIDTVPIPLQDLDFDVEADREQLLEGLRDLERSRLSS